MSDKYVSTPVGFARVNRAPLDKYTQFNNLQDAIGYAAHGPSYTGENIAVCFGGNDNNYGIYEVNKNRKLTPVHLNNTVNSAGLNELYVEKLGVIDWVLLYYHDTDKVYDDISNIGTCTNDPYKFSMLNHLELFRNSDMELSFMLRKNGVENRWKQKTNPVTMYKPLNGTTDGSIVSGNITRLELTDTDDAYITDYINKTYVSICPKTSSNDIIEIYVDATEYFGGDY